MTTSANPANAYVLRALWAAPYAGLLYMLTGYIMILFPYAGIWYEIPYNLLNLLRFVLAILPAWFWFGPAMQKAVTHLQRGAKWFPFVHFALFAFVGMIVTQYLFPYFGGIRAVQALSFMGILGMIFAGQFLLFAVVKKAWVNEGLDAYRYYWFAFDPNIRDIMEGAFMRALPQTDYQSSEKMRRKLRMADVVMAYMVNAALGFLLYPMYFMGQYGMFLLY